jgi:DNA-binding CsgD family transcriptional regulator
MVRGMTVKQIAEKMCLSPRTVEGYINLVKGKFGCKKRYELINKLLGKDFSWRDIFELIKKKMQTDE